MFDSDDDLLTIVVVLYFKNVRGIDIDGDLYVCLALIQP